MFRSWFATCPRGVEPALEGELRALGAKGVRPGQGVVRFTGEREIALRACLDLRTALRVLEPVGEFAAVTADELYAGALKLPWRDLVAKGQTIAVAASGRAEGLTNTHFVEQRMKDAVVDALRDRHGFRPDVDPRAPDVLIVVHLAGGKCSVSIDLAGELLSNRGYRVRTVEAPLREALAAAVVLVSGWDGTTPARDPVCGSGTLAIEAALFAARKAPNQERRLAAERSEGDARIVKRLREELAARVVAPPAVLASDRDPDAVEATRVNARAAGVQLRVEQADAREIGPLDPPGQLFLNVPYGERLEIGGRKQLKTFYHQLGAALRRLSGHRAAILSGNEDFESAFGVRPRGPKRVLWNGPLRCTLYTYVF
ncbi:MAG: class I SAM-dependent RNA methyltransferase [Myxococcales bacterium]|nr:THUMP domain-containing protein [Myxococcales bacterium]